MNRPFIIGIGGTYSGTGKTTLATAILKYFKNLNSKRSAPCSLNRWGFIKFTKTPSPPLIITDKKILMEKNKDTWRTIKAGASGVLWVKSPRSSIYKVLPESVKRLSHLDGIIVEGNSAIEFLNPDIVIFIFGAYKKQWKTGIYKLVSISDIIFYNNEAELPEISKKTKVFCKTFSDKKEYKGFFKFFIKLLMKKKLEKELDKNSIKRRISCADARKIAEGLKIPYREVGAAADEVGIKIKNCQLGCF